MQKEYNVKIVELPKKVLREKSQPIKIPLSQEDEELANKMIYHVTDSIKPNSKFRPAVGVAAVQYGILKQMFFVHLVGNDGKIIFSDVLINPKIISKSDSKVALRHGEGCLSVPEKYHPQEGYVKRSLKIMVEAYSFNNKKVQVFEANHYLAIIFQHELDHLDGKLFIDHLDLKQPWKKDKDLIII